MKKALQILLVFVVASTMVQAQYYTTSFEEFNTGDGIVSTAGHPWQLWPGSSVDALVTDAQAASGSNALEIVGTNAMGGPLDIVIDFDGCHSTGLFEVALNMYVPSANDAYFNFQGTANPGSIWTLNGFFVEGGVSITDGTNTEILTFDYTPDAWFNLKIAFRFDAQAVAFFMDDELVGNVPDFVGTICSMNQYPTSASTWYLDDVTYSVNGATADDWDADGFTSDVDCDDMNPDINPEAVEIPNNGIDEDCDGEDLVSSVYDEILNEMSIIPNPTDGLTSINLDLRKGALVQVGIFSITGQQVHSVNFGNQTGKAVLPLDLQHLNSGLYLTRVQLDDQIITQKLSVE